MLCSCVYDMFDGEITVGFVIQLFENVFKKTANINK